MALQLRDVTNIEAHNMAQMRQTVQVLSDNDSGCDIMDDSLTDIQWLQKMDATGAEIPGAKHGGASRKSRVTLTEKQLADTEIKLKIMKESCRKKLDYCCVKKGTNNKPPLSYASLISLAICSTPQRMLTLSGIYRWIENTFPFYRTPESKAWKNSIRHNLSIRKNMFMKVYQYPPRRGNGSYWTLLADGEDELKRAIPLFSTFQPPLIDQNCIYNRVPITHTVKSRGQFVPVLPRSDGALCNQPYFSRSGSLISASGMTLPQDEVVVLRSSEELLMDSANSVMQSSTHCTSDHYDTPDHLLDHSYAKQLCGDAYILGQSSMNNLDSSIDSEATVEAPSTPKRRRLVDTPMKRPNHSSRVRTTTNRKGGRCKSPVSNPPSTSVMATPSRDHDISLSFLDSSLVTPLKEYLHNIEIGSQSISFSPLFANFVSPAHSNTPQRPSTSSHTVNSLPSPLTPPLNALNIDSGIFTPFRPNDSLESLNMKCSTPLKFLSPITDFLPPNTFSSPHQDMFPPLKVFDSSTGSSATPVRLGSLHLLGLPGFTPPSTVSR